MLATPAHANSRLRSTLTARAHALRSGITSALRSAAPRPQSPEDTQASIDFLVPANAKRLRLDRARIVLIGHSMGGFNAVQTAAGDRP